MGSTGETPSPAAEPAPAAAPPPAGADTPPAAPSAPEPTPPAPAPEPTQAAAEPVPKQAAPAPEPTQAAPAPEPTQAAAELGPTPPATEPVPAAPAPVPAAAAPPPLVGAGAGGGDGGGRHLRSSGRRGALVVGVAAAVVAAAVGVGVALAAGSGGDRTAAGEDDPVVTTAPPTTAAPTTQATLPPTTVPPTTVPPTTVPPTTTPPTTVPPTAEADGTLRLDEDGPAVANLQRRLNDLGYWLGGAGDGHYGQLTRQAVMAFQKVEGLGRDGVAGPITLKRLTTASRPRPRGGGGLEIDLARQVIFVVQGGQVRWVLNTSTGSGEAYASPSGGSAIAATPPGHYHINRQIDGVRAAPLGNLYRPKYFNGGIAVHGAGNIPAHPASHGCARVTNAAMDMLWASGAANMGTPVWVY
ncbi:MAG TPA: L,D-transpeptidase family protein [Acidimicrobiales bacterium]|nr:L,D-transpeptidase family protein [Acidimicrobiales bacterium]